MIGHKLRELRKRQGMTQRELAAMTHVSLKSVKNWEADSSNPNLESFCLLTNIFHVSADYLLNKAVPDTVDLSPLSEYERRKVRSAIQAYIDTALELKKQTPD